MRLSSLSQIAVLACAIAAGLGYFSFWWVLIPVFFAGSFQMVNGPGYDLVSKANREGRLGVLPTMLVTHSIPWLALGAAVYWLTSVIDQG